MTIVYLIASVVVAIIIAEIIGLQKSNQQKWFLTFSGAYLFAVTIVHILPESFHEHSPNTGLFILFGFLLQFSLDFISGGIEHGHHNKHPHKGRLPIGLMLGLFIHAIIEGIPTSIHHNHEHILLSAILLHKIPISIILYVFLKQATSVRWKQILGITLFALCAPIGYLLGDNLQFLSNNADYLLAFTAGIFLHVSTSIIFENGAEHKFNIYKLIAALSGFVLAYLTVTLH